MKLKGSMLDTIAIGDVHGRADLLEIMLEFSREELGDPRVIFLGDIIDRGPSSRQALDLVQEELCRNSQSVLIQGNHEDLMLRFIDGGADSSRGWRWNGGDQTVASYGINGFGFRDDDGFERFEDELAELFMEHHGNHLDLIRAAPSFFETQEYFFVHAGIDPSVSLDQQDPYLMRWNGKLLMAHHGPLAKMVVHGHTVTESRCPELHANRINLDTGAYDSNKLSAAWLRKGIRPTFLTASSFPGEDRMAWETHAATPESHPSMHSY